MSACPDYPLTRRKDYDTFLLCLKNVNLVANKKTTTTIPDFESAFKKLESIVSTMEGGELSLEQALKYFEEGVVLTRQCQQALQQAEQRVQQLLDQEQPLALVGASAEE